MNHHLQWTQESIPNVPDDKQIQFLQSNRKTTSITWVGHSTFLIQTGGLNILTDPIWTSFMGLKRRISAPEIHLDELPAIDVVLLSHGQHLWLHFHTFHRIKGDPLYLVPNGLQEVFIGKGFNHVKEVSWWNHFVKIPLQFTFVPSHRGTRKSLFDEKKCSTGGWICHNPKTKEHIYFAGDTGYFPGFTEIGRKYAIDIAIIPIGPSKPQWFRKTDVMPLEDAVQAFIDVQAKQFIPMQNGTVAFSESEQELWTRLRDEWRKRGLLDHTLRLLRQGETWKIESSPSNPGPGGGYLQ
ncbi:MBL fold metallo-hydrolase [Ammoniphilus sp. YIM 78166]|uniref:MBL fold metallo-hydrolase n=1 Tax=Ammoniphilus sp. YIM 78166 TaxID=1644106 RepID=UPI00106F0C4E|nr:MBL fold metallo-hydrolase [Ammoniphilus sp. YIM 78166]